MLRVNAQAVTAALHHHLSSGQRADERAVARAMDAVHAGIAVGIAQHDLAVAAVADLALPDPAAAVVQLADAGEQAAAVVHVLVFPVCASLPAEDRPGSIRGVAPGSRASSSASSMLLTRQTSHLAGQYPVVPALFLVMRTDTRTSAGPAQ